MRRISLAGVQQCALFIRTKYMAVSHAIGSRKSVSQFNTQQMARAYSYLKETKNAVETLRELANALELNKNLETLGSAVNFINTEFHKEEFNNRLHSILYSPPEATRCSPAVLLQYKELASIVSISSFSSSRLGSETTDILMESLQKSFILHPAGVDPVQFDFQWSLTRNNMPGVVRNEFSAVILANGTRIASASDVHSACSAQALSAIQAHLGDHAAAVDPADFGWFLAFAATFPSDEAFDVVSDVFMPKKS